MSLINKMLQDLEQRNANAESTRPISGEVRAVTGPRSSSLLTVVGVVLVALAAGAGAWIYLGAAAKKPVISVADPVLKPVQQPVPASPVATPTPAEDAMPTVAAPAGPVVDQGVESQVPAQPAAPERRLPGLDTTLAVVPASAASAVPPKPAQTKPVADVPAAEVAAKPESSEPSKPRPAPRAASASAGGSMKVVSPGQQSDNFYRQSVTLLQQGRVAEAQDALRKALETNPRNLLARQSLVGLLVEGKHNSEAVQLLQDGLKLAPEQSGFSMALARLQVEAGDAKVAVETLEQGLPHAGEDADYHAFYAALAQRDERHDAAVAHYLIALKSNPAMPSWLVGIGISWQAQGKLADAREAFQRARDTGQLTPQLSQFVEQRLKQIKQAR